MFKIILLWLFMAACAILNGVVREKILNRYFRKKTSLQISGIILSIVIFIISWFYVSSISHKTFEFYLFVGIFWLSLTLIFEYGLGYFVERKTISDINKIFNIKNGDLFLLVLFSTAFSPLIVAVIKKYRANKHITNGSKGLRLRRSL